jgi:Ca-activated chloride channel family protein
MFDFAWPWVFAALPLPWLMRIVLPVADSGEPVLKIGFLAELEGLAGRRARINLPAWRQQLPYIFLWLLLLSAAARPQWLGAPLPIAASGRDLLVAVDVSGSMDYPDMQWQGEDITRLTLVKNLLGDFLEKRKGDRVGLILFGSRAYLQAPLTFDRRTVHTWLDDAQVGIYTIGIGADPQRAASIGVPGLNPSLDLDEPTLQSIANLTHGSYFRARDGAELQHIGASLDQLEPVAQQPTQARPAKALYSWPLATALGLSMLLAWREHWSSHPLQRWLARLPWLAPLRQWRERLRRLRPGRHL